MKNNDYPMNLILDFALRSMERKWARDVQMVRMRYRDGMTFQAIGATYGLTLERARQCIKRSLRKIRSSRLLMDLICRGAEVVAFDTKYLAEFKKSIKKGSNENGKR